MTDTVRRLLADAATRLTGAAVAAEEARAEAEVLACHALGVDRAWLYAHADDAIARPASQAFEALLARRLGGEPVAYLVGRRAFHAIDLEVTPAVLIPRADTEVLVEAALARIDAAREVSVADLGTGSGAIALAIAHARPRARVLATDASAAALAVARANAMRLGLGQVQFAQGSWWEAVDAACFDVVVSNPPYIAQGDPHLHEGDLRHEPAAALASGVDGLDALRSIVAGAPGRLLPGGWLLLEHGHAQGAAVRALLTAAGFEAVETWPDIERRDRVSGGRRRD